MLRDFRFLDQDTGTMLLVPASSKTIMIRNFSWFAMIL